MIKIADPAPDSVLLGVLEHIAAHPGTEQTMSDDMREGLVADKLIKGKRRLWITKAGEKQIKQLRAAAKRQGR